LRHHLQKFLKTASQFAQSLTHHRVLIGLLNVMDLLEILQNPVLHLLCVKFSINFSLGQLFIHLQFIMKISFFSFDKKVLLPFLLEHLSVFE
jgi:hypothetical protein